MQVDNGADHQDVHDLVAVAPVVEQAGAEALGDLDYVDQSPEHGQSVHDQEEAEGLGAAHPAPEHPEQEEAEAEQALPDESPQTQEVSVGRGGTVDPVGRQEDVGQQGSLLDRGIAEEGDVDDGESSWRGREQGITISWWSFMQMLNWNEISIVI